MCFFPVMLHTVRYVPPRGRQSARQIFGTPTPDRASPCLDSNLDHKVQSAMCVSKVNLSAFIHKTVSWGFLLTHQNKLPYSSLHISLGDNATTCTYLAIMPGNHLNTKYNVIIKLKEKQLVTGNWCWWIFQGKCCTDPGPRLDRADLHVLLVWAIGVNWTSHSVVGHWSQRGWGSPSPEHSHPKTAKQREIIKSLRQHYTSLSLLWYCWDKKKAS